MHLRLNLKVFCCSYLCELNLCGCSLLVIQDLLIQTTRQSRKSYQPIQGLFGTGIHLIQSLAYCREVGLGGSLFSHQRHLEIRTSGQPPASVLSTSCRTTVKLDSAATCDA